MKKKTIISKNGMHTGSQLRKPKRIIKFINFSKHSSLNLKYVYCTLSPILYLRFSRSFSPMETPSRPSLECMRSQIKVTININTQIGILKEILSLNLTIKLIFYISVKYGIFRTVIQN